MADKKLERKELPALARIAMREASKNHERIMTEIVEAAGQSLDVNPGEWQFDAQTMTFVREV